MQYSTKMRPYGARSRASTTMREAAHIDSPEWERCCVTADERADRGAYIVAHWFPFSSRALLGFPRGLGARCAPREISASESVRLR